jgi:hypothetical protein
MIQSRAGMVNSQRKLSLPIVKSLFNPLKFRALQAAPDT